MAAAAAVAGMASQRGGGPNEGGIGFGLLHGSGPLAFASRYVAPTVHYALIAFTVGLFLRWPATSVFFVLEWIAIVARTEFVPAFVRCAAAAAPPGGGGGAAALTMERSRACAGLSMEIRAASLSTNELSRLGERCQRCFADVARDEFSRRPWTGLLLSLLATWIAAAAAAGILEELGKAARHQSKRLVRGAAGGTWRAARFVLLDVWIRLFGTAIRFLAEIVRGLARAAARAALARRPAVGEGPDDPDPRAQDSDDRREHRSYDPYEEEEEEIDGDYVPGEDSEDDDDGEDAPYDNDEYDEDEDLRALLDDDGLPPFSPRRSARLGAW
jgi:hypothetical protein